MLEGFTFGLQSLEVGGGGSGIRDFAFRVLSGKVPCKPI